MRTWLFSRSTTVDVSTDNKLNVLYNNSYKLWWGRGRRVEKHIAFQAEGCEFQHDGLTSPHTLRLFAIVQFDLITGCYNGDGYHQEETCFKDPSISKVRLLPAILSARITLGWKCLLPTNFFARWRINKVRVW